MIASRTFIRLQPGADLEGFRHALRALIAAGVHPDDVDWAHPDQGGLLAANSPLPAGPEVRLPPALVDLVRLVVCHRDAERYALLHRLVWRICRGERDLLEVASDPLVHRIGLLAKAVRRDLHKMHAFLRFRPRQDPDGAEHLVAWFEPDNFILRAATAFFASRFASQRWTIMTPEGTAVWDGTQVIFGAPRCPDDAVATDPFEAGWRGYYESTFNPARINLAAMRREMPRKYWRHIPETQAIADLTRAASHRVADMLAHEAAADDRPIPKALSRMLDRHVGSLGELNEIIRRSPPMVAGGTRAVLGEGPLRPAIAFVGEQPGDQEDVAGRPFVGPAGQLLSRALSEAGIDRAGCYLTNAVKHFKYEQRGKRRIHQKPTMGEIKHYRWWLLEELRLVEPRFIVALGGSAASALEGKAVAVMSARGLRDFDRTPGLATVHPSYLLRLPDEQMRGAAYAAFVDDLRTAARVTT